MELLRAFVAFFYGIALAFMIGYFMTGVVQLLATAVAMGMIAGAGVLYFLFSVDMIIQDDCKDVASDEREL